MIKIYLKKVCQNQSKNGWNRSKKVDSIERDEIDQKLINFTNFWYIFDLFQLNRPMLKVFGHFCCCFNQFCSYISDLDDKFELDFPIKFWFNYVLGSLIWSHCFQYG